MNHWLIAPLLVPLTAAVALLFFTGRSPALRRTLSLVATASLLPLAILLVRLFGAERVFVELTDHDQPLDSSHNDALAGLAAARGLATIATGNVHYATPAEHRLAQAVAAVRANRSLDELDAWLPASGSAFLRSGVEMVARFRRYPGSVARTVGLAEELAFPLRRAKPAVPFGGKYRVLDFVLMGRAPRIPGLRGPGPADLDGIWLASGGEASDPCANGAGSPKPSMSRPIGENNVIGTDSTAATRNRLRMSATIASIDMPACPP